MAKFSELLSAKTAEEKKAALDVRHPLWTSLHGVWKLLIEAFEGTGGFLTGEYIWRFPRENDNEFKGRQEQARYHNYAESLINLYVRHIFHRGIERKTTNTELEAWWTDIDGARTTIDTFLKRVLRLALAAGHTGVLVDKTADAAVGPSRADERARVIARLYVPQAILDWRVRHEDEVIAVKLAEERSSADILAALPSDTRYLLWNVDAWARIEQTEDDVAIAEAEHGLGLVPFAVLRPRPSAATPFIGHSLLGNANVFRALFNRCSEEDVVLRTQAFSLLTVSVPADGNVEHAREDIGGEVGPTRALVVRGTVDYKTPSQEVPKSIRENVSYLVREIFRMAHVVYQRDSLEAESAEAIALKHDELNEMLTGIAGECAALERNLARFFLAWQSSTSDQAMQAFDQAQVEITYPREFFVKELMAELEAWAAAIRMDLGLTMTKRIKKRAAQAVDPDMDLATKEQVEKEIDAQTAPVPLAGDAAALRAAAQERLKRMAAGEEEDAAA